MKDWADRARHARRRAGLTQRQLAKAADVSQGVVALIENGYDSTAETRDAIARALGRDPEQLFPADPVRMPVVQ